jgi:hypothetical protein
MFTDPRQLIDQTIDDLQSLSAYLEDEAGGRLADPARLTPQARMYKEALLTISVLIPKLRAARLSHEPLRYLRACEACDDF